MRPLRLGRNATEPPSAVRGREGKNPMGALRLEDNPRTEPGLQASDIAQLRQTIRGDLVVPGDANYDQARRVWNGMVDRKPATVIYCAGSWRGPQRRRLFGV
jgi:hypothetical protein